MQINNWKNINIGHFARNHLSNNIIVLRFLETISYVLSDETHNKVWLRIAHTVNI